MAEEVEPEVRGYRVDFKFTVEDQASMYVIAETPEKAEAGCLAMLMKHPQISLGNPQVTQVEEYSQAEATEQVKQTLN